MGSEQFKLAVADVKPLIIGAMLAMGGALVAYITTQVATLDLTTTKGMFLAAAASIVLNVLRKFMTDTRGQ